MARSVKEWTKGEATIRLVEASEQDRALSVQVLAFAADPVIRWLWPEPDPYIRLFPELLRGFGGGAFSNDGAHVSDNFLGASLWLPPGVMTDDAALEALAREHVAASIRDDLFGIFEALAGAVPTEPHWHLAFVGVDPSAQGRGLGAALLRHVLPLVDAQGSRAYLESTNPRNITLYERFGFALQGEIQIGSAPPLYPMVRPPIGSPRAVE